MISKKVQRFSEKSMPLGSTRGITLDPETASGMMVRTIANPI
jgi:hypothetical protein